MTSSRRSCVNVEDNGLGTRGRGSRNGEESSRNGEESVTGLAHPLPLLCTPMHTSHGSWPHRTSLRGLAGLAEVSRKCSVTTTCMRRTGDERQ